MAWCGNTRRTVRDFANFLEVKENNLSYWMAPNGKIPNSANLAKIAKHFPEAYSVLNLLSPFDVKKALLSSNLPPEFVASFVAAYNEYNAELERKGIIKDTPEAMQISSEIFSKHGLNVSKIMGED